MHARVQAKLSQLCLTLHDSMDYSPLGFCVYQIVQARILEWVAMSFSRGSSWPRNRTRVSYVSCIGMWVFYCSVQFSSVQFNQSCPILCDPMDYSTPSFPVHHQLPEPTQTQVHCIGDAIQPSHPLSSPSPPAFNLSQHQGLFKWVGSSHQVAKVLELQHQFFQWIFRTNFL